MTDNVEPDAKPLDYRKEREQKRNFSQDQMEYWLEELKTRFPHVDEGLLWNGIDMYSTHTEIFENTVEEYKKDPSKFPPKDRSEKKDEEYSIDESKEFESKESENKTSTELPSTD